MKAVVYHQYGAPDVLSLADLPKPMPGDKDVLVRIVATTVSSADWRARSLELPKGFGLIGRLVFGIFGPRKPVLGGELSGVVEAVGNKVTRFAPGDEVFAYTGADFGCHAEYRVLAEDAMMMRKPANLTFEEAAALSFGATTAIDYLRNKGGLKNGDKVLVVGASGSVGSAAVQIAKHFGAEVTGVCSTANMELVRQLGADRVIDYTAENFTENGETYDIILNTNGDTPFRHVEASLKPGGRLLLVLGSIFQTLGMERPPRASGKKVIAGVANPGRSHMELIAELAAAGSFKPLIDRIYPLEDAREAHAYVDTGRKRGNVVLAVGSGA